MKEKYLAVVLLWAGSLMGQLQTNQLTVGTNPHSTGQAVIVPDDEDTVHSWIRQAGHNMHFRLSTAVPNLGGAQNFLIVPYTYGMALEYAGTLEAWVANFSVHMNHQISPPNTPAYFWVGDEQDTGGFFATAFYNGGGPGMYTAIASQTFNSQSHGYLAFQVRDPVNDSFKFEWGPYGHETTHTAINPTGIWTDGTVTATSFITTSLVVGSGTPILDHYSRAEIVAFPAMPANSCSTRSISVAGADDGDSVNLGIPNALGSINGATWFAWVSAPDTVSIRGCTLSAITPQPASIRVDVWKH